MNTGITVTLLGCQDQAPYFDAAQGFRLLGCYESGEEGLIYIKEHRPDLVVLDLVLVGCDGLEIIRAIRRDIPSTRILVLTYVSQPAMIERAIALGADFYLIRPVSSEVLLQRAVDVVMPTPQRTTALSIPTRALDERLSNVFLTVGIPAHIKGYQFLREAVKVSMSHPDAIGNITKSLYPAVAARFHTSASKVERAIRHAIEVAWNRGRIESINTIFGVKAYTGSDKPTNGEFIALIADKLMTEIA